MAGRDFQETMVSNDLFRRYHVHLPPHYDASSPLPLLIALHGRLGTGKKMIKQTGFNGIADREGFIAVYPEGFKRGWADGRGITHADKRVVNDVAFIDRSRSFRRNSLLTTQEYILQGIQMEALWPSAWPLNILSILRP